MAKHPSGNPYDNPPPSWKLPLIDHVSHRQRRYFYYLTGCNLPDSYLTYDIATEKSTLYIPPIEPDSVIWSGLPVSVEEALALYDVDAVLTSDQVNPSLTKPSSGSTVWAIANQVSAHITFLEFNDKDFTLLKEAIEECRAIKDDFEVALTKKANAISTFAHTAVLQAVKKAKNERELHALFIGTCMAHGAKEQAYSAIVASGTAPSTLHYVKNDEPLAGKLNVLLDAGAEYGCYASDIVSLAFEDGVQFFADFNRQELSPSPEPSARRVERSMILCCRCNMFAPTCWRKAYYGTMFTSRLTLLPLKVSLTLGFSKATRKKSWSLEQV